MTSPKWRRPMYHKKNLPEGVNIVGVGIPKISKRSDKSFKSYSKKSPPPPGRLRVNHYEHKGSKAQDVCFNWKKIRSKNID